MKQHLVDRVTKPIRSRLDTGGFALPKPGPKVKAQPKDGRLVESKKEYRETKHTIWVKQNRRCAKCRKWLPTPAHGERHHIFGRGMGGGKRDDRHTVLLCRGIGGCHEKIHGRR